MQWQQRNIDKDQKSGFGGSPNYWGPCWIKDFYSSHVTPPNSRTAAICSLSTSVSCLPLLLHDYQQITRAVSSACGFGFAQCSVHSWTVLCGHVKSQISAQYQGNLGKYK